MVSKSLTLIALLLCAILAQTVTAKVTSKADKADSDSEDDSSDDSDSEDSNDDDEDESDDESEDEDEEALYPSLNCLLFKDIGCNSECSVMASAFGHKATGTCDDQDNICDCSVTRKQDSLESLWKAKFDSKDILQQIKKNKNLSEQVSDILNEPFQTAQETKDELESVLSKDQHKKLKLNDDSEAAKMIKKGKLDSVAIKKYVTDKLSKTLKTSDNKKLSTFNYKSALLEALKNAKKESKDQDNDALNELVSDVHRTRNKSLSDILTKYLNKNNLKPPKDNNESSAAETITDYVTDLLVKRADKKKPATTKKPVKKPIQKKKGKKPNDDDDDDDDEETSDVTLKKDRFVLKNIDKSIFRRSGPINQNLEKNGYSVRYQRSPGNDINLVWIKGVDEARLQKSSGADRNQNWKFGNVTIRISKSAGGDINENWNFGNTSYRYSKSAGGYRSSNWANGKSDKKKLKTYQRFIDAWCRANDFLMERHHCIIYDS